MRTKDNGTSRNKNRQCLTLTADVSDVLRAINNNANWKNNTNKLTKTIIGKTMNHEHPLMTEEDLDQLFNKSKNKIKTQAKLDVWKNQAHKDFISSVKFLKVDDEWDRLLTGLPSGPQLDQGRISQLFQKTSSPDEQDKKIDLTQQFKKNYLVGKIVGEGAYASVRVAIYKPLNKKIAIKVYEKNKIKQSQRKKSVRREIKILQILDHPNIVKIYDVVETNHHLNIVMEYLPGISLNTYLKNQQGHKCTQKNCRKIIRGLIEALKYLHERRISHRDIKLENIILDQNLSPKLIDFGFSTCIQSHKKVKIFCGTPSYMAPQIVQKKQYRGEPADIWAIGVLFFVALTGIFPFKGSTDQQLYKKINNADYSKLQIPSKDSADLIAKMLKINPQQRIKASQILLHPWIKSQNNSASKKLKKIDSSLDGKKRTTISSHKSKEDVLINNNKKLAETYKENIKMELKLARQSPSNYKLNKKQQLSNQNNNTQLYINTNVNNNNNNNKLLKTDKIVLNSSSKRENIKAHSKVLDLLRMEMKKRHQEKSKGKLRRT